MYHSESFVNPLEQLPEDAYWQACELSAHLRVEELKATRRYAHTVQGLRQEYLDRLYALIGTDNRQRYFELRQKHHGHRRAVRREKPSADGRQRRLVEIREQAVAESKAFISESGIDLEAIRRLQNEYQAKTSALSFDPGGKKNDIVAQIVPKTKNQTFTPPYDGWMWRYSWSRSGGLPNPLFSRYLNHQTGEVGSSTSISVIGADNSDTAEIMYRTAVRQWYQMPSTGQVQVRIKVESIDTPYSGSTVNEWGWSNVEVTQRARFYAQVVSPVVTPRAYYIYWLDYHQNDVTSNWSTNVWDTGESGEIGPFTIPGVFSEDTWVYVAVGLETDNKFWADDCTVISNVKQRYFFQEIGLSSSTG